MNSIFEIFWKKMIQYIISVSGGLLIAFESSIVYFIPCLLLTILDVYSAYCLGKRVHKKYPEKADGKFKSKYKYRIALFMLLMLMIIILAHYVDMYVIKDGDFGVRFVMIVFIIYQGISIAENWSSENPHKGAKLLQKILVDKSKRHLNIDISDLFKKEESDEHN